MTCKYCNDKLAPLRSLTDGEFCSDEHRQAYYHEHPDEVVQDFSAEEALPTAFDSGPVRPVQESISHQAVDIAFSAESPAEPDCAAAPVHEEATFEADSPAFEQEIFSTAPQDSWFTRWIRPHFTRSWTWLATAWNTAPTELKAMALLLPVLLALACSPLMPKLQVHLPANQADALRARTRQALEEEWKSLGVRISNRAAIAITDDFRSGLDSWKSRSNLTATWSFDRNGFVQPGPLAILKPTEDLTDYSFEFLGEVEHRAVGAAFRARDLDNYYAVKFIADDSGPLPALRLIRYTVINGKEGPHAEKVLPTSIRADMLNRFRVDVRGSDFTILAQGEVVDFFSDARLTTGGVGFFCGRGEKARLRWVEVSHQYDTLGRLCAFLAPVNLTGVDKD